MARLRNQRDEALTYYRHQHVNMYGAGRMPGRVPAGMRARGVVVHDGEDEEAEDSNLDVDTIDSVPTGASSSATSTEQDTDSQNDNNLQCPRCKKEYAAEEHNRFLEHIDECCS